MCRVLYLSQKEKVLSQKARQGGRPKVKYLPIQWVARLLPLAECQAKCDRLNDKYLEAHFKPQWAGNGYQVVAAKREGG